MESLPCCEAYGILPVRANQCTCRKSCEDELFGHRFGWRLILRHSSIVVAVYPVRLRPCRPWGREPSPICRVRKRHASLRTFFTGKVERKSLYRRRAGKYTGK